MRWLVIVVVHVVLVQVASAAPTTSCYAGTDSANGASLKIVLSREIDRGAGTIRIRSWRENAPHRVSDQLLRVGPDGHAFTHEARGLTGNGTLDGTPWAWTGYRHSTTAYGGTLGTTAQISAARWQSETRFEHRGRELWKKTITATAIDCHELERLRAAFDDSAPDAVRTCFEGGQRLLGNRGPVVVEQIVEPKRIVFVIATAQLDNRVVFSIAGRSITVTNGHAWSGQGTLEGTPGAWTGYAYNAHVDGRDVSVVGTIGRTRITRADTLTGRPPGTAELDATAFDCAKLEERLATLTMVP